MVCWEVLEGCLVGSKAGERGGGGGGRGLLVASAGASSPQERGPQRLQLLHPQGLCRGLPSTCLPCASLVRQDLASAECGQLLGWPDVHFLSMFCSAKGCV